MDTLSNKCGIGCKKDRKKGKTKKKRRDDLLVPPIVIVVFFFKKRLPIHVRSFLHPRSIKHMHHPSDKIIYIPTYIPYTSHRNHTLPRYMYSLKNLPPIQIPYKSKLLSSKHNDDTPPPPPPPPPNPSKRIPIPPFSNSSPIGVKMLLL